MAGEDRERFQLRRAEPRDAEAVFAVLTLSRRAAMPYLPEVHGEDETRAWVRHVLLPRQEVWVAEVEGRVVGVAALAGEMLEQLYVHPEHQGRGIGSALFARAIARYPTGFTFYAFQRNTRARAFYERRGCVAVAFGDGSENEEGEPDVLYRWMPGGGRSSSS